MTDADGAERERQELLMLVADLQSELAELKRSPSKAKTRGKKEEKEEQDPLPWCWQTMAAADIPAARRDLADWVNWLRSRWSNAAAVVLPCWWRHGAAIEILTGLRWLWAASYLTGAANDPAHFVDTLDRQLRLLAEVGAGCSANQHFPTPALPETDDPELEAWLTGQPS